MGISREETGAGVRRQLVVPDFFDGAGAMREVFADRMGRARSRGREEFVWDYWHVPGQYTYIRTFGDRYFPDELTGRLLDRLRRWGLETLGCGSITPPWLSYYVDGCVQELHADVPQGPWAYVLSLTHWDERGFSGGETEMLRPEVLDFWGALDANRALERRDLLERIAPEFNQLTVFDARIPHGVREVRGTHHPLDSRVVLHGWFEYPQLRISEDLDERARVSLQLAAAMLPRRLARYGGLTGLLTVRLAFGGDGEVRHARVLSNTLFPASGAREAAGTPAATVLEALADLKVPGASDASWAVVPLRMPAGDRREP
jgi:hypothetical protein